MRIVTSRDVPVATSTVGARDDAFVEALAAELELDVATVVEALDAAHAKQRAEVMAERVAELEGWLVAAVDDGKLTAEQAAAILAGSEDGVLPFQGDRRPSRCDQGSDPTDPDPAA